MKKRKSYIVKSISHAQRKAESIVFILLIIVTGLYVYASSLSGEFIWDDDDHIKNNINIKHWHYLQKIFTENAIADDINKPHFYRPLQIFSYLIDYSFWKLNTVGYHLTNILLHVLVAMCVYWLVNSLWADRLLSLFTSMLFIVHPVHTEAVAYISGRADPLAALFMLLCFTLYIKQTHLKNVTTYIFMLFSYMLALLSKEYSLILPALVLLYHFTFKKRILRRDFFSLLIIALFYILVRLTVLRQLLPDISNFPGLLQRLAGFFVAITNYTMLIFLPFNLHMEYGMGSFDFTSPRAIAGILILATLLIYVCKKRKSNRLAFFSISWFLVALLPVSNIYPLNAYMAEHWLYLPSIGLFIFLANGLCFIYRAKNFRIFAIIFVMGLLAFYSYLTIRQNEYWSQPLVFYKKTLKYAPRSPRIYNNLGMAYNNLGDFQQAIAAYNKAIKINPDFADTYNNLGATYNNLGDFQQAIALYTKALEIDPNFAKAYNNLGVTYGNLGDFQQAIALCNKAIEIIPNFAKAYNNLGVTYKKLGDFQQAIALYTKALEIDPDLIEIYNNLAIAHYYQKQYVLAIKYADKAIGLGYRVDSNFLKLLELHR